MLLSLCVFLVRLLRHISQSHTVSSCLHHSYLGVARMIRSWLLASLCLYLPIATCFQSYPIVKSLRHRHSLTGHFRTKFDEPNISKVSKISGFTQLDDIPSSGTSMRRRRPIAVTAARVQKAWKSMTAFAQRRRRPPSFQSNISSTNKRKGYIPWLFSTALTASIWLMRPKFILAMTASAGTKTPVLPMKREQLISAVTLWFVLFVALALLHAAEIAITTLYPWKVKEFAEEEEKQNAGSNRKGTFAILNEDITRVLTTILVSSTAASIYATTIFTHVVSSIYGPRGDTYGAIALTGITLFFVELLPKSIGVTNAERVARFMVPPINMISTVVSPLGFSLSWLSKQVLNIFGLKGKEGVAGVSDSELRLIVMGARDSGTIDHSEQEMIKGVLNLQSRLVREIMRPRVDIVAVPKEMSVASVLAIVRESGYSRIPVYDEEIDNIIGIVLAKSVLDFFVQGVLVENHKASEQDSLASYSLRSFNGQATKGYVRALTGAELASRMEKSITDADLIEECYFVPATANGWAVLQEMRKRRVHMAVVVDEYGGTEGLVSLEDIVEEVVGEIYDEDDDASYEFSEDSITLQEDGTFLIRGEAELEDCDLILGLKLVEEETLKDFGTLSGFLCMCAGEIPKVGDIIMSRGWSFEVIDADPKRILQVKVARLVGFLDGNGDEEEDNPILGFLRKGLGKKATENDTESSDVDFIIPDAEFSTMGPTTLTPDEANNDDDGDDDDGDDKTDVTEEHGIRIDRMVEESGRKKSYVRQLIAEMNQDE